MFDILNGEDNLFEVYYSGTLLDTFLSREQALDYIDSMKVEMYGYSGA